MNQIVDARRQLTLFLPPDSAAPIEAVRRRVDPIQFDLIGAHVTLCREDELSALTLPVLRQRLARAALVPLTLVFGAPTPFSDHGMLLPCIKGMDAFHELRVAVLDKSTIRPHAAHVTLAHPRNPRAVENIAATYAELPSSIAVTFATIALIEQRGTSPWDVRHVLDFAGRDAEY